ncbi:MAG: DUF4315 family protein [Provencibacterium sp.]|jgi:hypothetical protein|nr:DUF4315 family protein [Provencibacterium sp.]
MNTEKLKAELAKARQKAALWQARVRAYEKKLTAQENMEILQAVRDVAATPEELRGLLDTIRAAQEPAAKINMKEEPDEG